MSIQDTVIEAIKSRRKMELNYKGDGLRLVHPHALFVSTKGKTIIDAFQISGYSSQSEKMPDWRQFDISNITHLKVLEETFHVASGYNSLSDRYSNKIEKI